MTEDCYSACLKAWQNSPGNQKMWPQLAQRFGYPSGESLRSAFKRERISRNVKNKFDEDRGELNKKIVAVVDIETLFMVLRLEAWSLDVQGYQSHQTIEKDSCMLSWAGKYLWEDTLYGDILTPSEAVNRDNERITESIWNFLRPCSVLIGHNIKNFDFKIINTEFLKHGLRPLKVQMIDTLEIARANFRFSSNKMAYINKVLGIRQKIENAGLPLWRGCSEGDKKSLREMLDYNIGDIVATEDLFWRFQPFIHNLPPMLSRSDGNPVCVCGCSEFVRDGYWETTLSKYTKMYCKKCGAISRGRKNLIPKNRSASQIRI